MRRVVLSKRLQMLADMVTAGSRVADVGCDHGYLSIWLVQAGVSPGALAMDVRKGPLAAAREHVEAYGLGDYIETRLSDGLKGCEAGEAEVFVCAGMGGRLMERILTESMEKAKGFAELILQPQSELREFRAFLRREGFAVLKEEAVCEDGRFYFAMKAVPGNGEDSEAEAFWDEDFDTLREQRVYDRFGEKLVTGKNLVLLQYLQWRRKALAQLVCTLRPVDIPEAGDALKVADTLDAADTPGFADIPEAAGILEKGMTGPGRQRARLEELLVELADVEYALGRMQ